MKFSNEEWSDIASGLQMVRELAYKKRNEIQDSMYELSRSKNKDAKKNIDALTERSTECRHRIKRLESMILKIRTENKL
jgi:hypothetical protein